MDWRSPSISGVPVSRKPEFKPQTHQKIITIITYIRGNVTMKNPVFKQTLYFKKTKCHFLNKNREQEGKTGPVWGLVPMGGGEDIRKGYRRVNMVEYYVLMYENGKMRLF
jgi:hypothetical protein